MENYLATKHSKGITFQSPVDPINYRVITYNLYESEKVIKVYSATFSLIYEHEKEQRLSSVTYSHVFTSMRKNKD
jgi:hypothetical protein